MRGSSYQTLLNRAVAELGQDGRVHADTLSLVASAGFEVEAFETSAWNIWEDQDNA